MIEVLLNLQINEDGARLEAKPKLFPDTSDDEKKVTYQIMTVIKAYMDTLLEGAQMSKVNVSAKDVTDSIMDANGAAPSNEVAFPTAEPPRE